MFHTSLTPAETKRLLPVDDLMPGADERALFNNVSVVPVMDPIFAYSIVLPDGWYRLDSPGPTWELSEERFSALGVFTPAERMEPPVVVSCGVIQMPDGASVASCFERYCRVEELEILSVGPQELMAGAVVDGLVRRRVGGWDLTMRLTMFEDGGRLFGISGMAPSSIYPDVVRELSLALYSFELLWPLGPSSPRD